MTNESKITLHVTYCFVPFCGAELGGQFIYSLVCPYFSSKVIVRPRKASGHFVTIIEVNMHLNKSNSDNSGVCNGIISPAHPIPPCKVEPAKYRTLKTVSHCN